MKNEAMKQEAYSYLLKIVGYGKIHSVEVRNKWLVAVVINNGTGYTLKVKNK